MDYLRLLDFGFRSAVINRCARYKARQEWTEVNQTVASAVVYFMMISTPMLPARDPRSVTPRWNFFKISRVAERRAAPDSDHAFSISERLIVSPITGALEAVPTLRSHQPRVHCRADGSRRRIDYAALSGYGLIGLAVLTVCVQIE